jgi:hypothetical protein
VYVACVDTVVAVGVIVGIFVYARRNRVDARNVHDEPTVLVRPKRSRKQRQADEKAARKEGTAK